FGVRVALPMIRQGRATTAAELAKSLDSRSGVVALREDLLERFANRRDVLRARSALLAVDRLLTDLPVAAAVELQAEIERIRAGAHAFAEIRLLNDCRRGLVAFPGVEDDDVERLLGTAGTTPAARLGLPADAEHCDVRVKLLAEIEKWQRKGAHPLADKGVTDAASVLVRTCEGALADLG
ncbi:MAG: dynamin family protein, partial [Acidimicrobiales bacterium]